MLAYSASDIFTPSSPATRDGFVERPSLTNLLIDAIQTRGKQLVVYGHTGTGKTTLLNNKLNQTYEDFIVTRCTSDMTFNQLVLSAFDSIGQFVVASKTRNQTKSIGINLEADYATIKGALGLDYGLSKSEELRPLVPPQLTPQKLASFFGVTNSCWVIDDFHKMPKEEKKQLSQWMKVFMDESTNYPFAKIIALGAVGSAKEVIDLDKELNNRVSEIFVPFMSDDELKEIISRGEQKLNLAIGEDVKNKILKFSAGLPSVTHQLCLNLCFSKGIYNTAEIRTSFDLSDFQEALTGYVLTNSGYLHDRYEKATLNPDPNTIPIYYHIIRAFMTSKLSSLSMKDVSKYFIDHKHPQSEGLLEYLLDQLTKDGRGNALKFDEGSKTWSVRDPFFRVYCLCAIDLSKSVMQAQLDLFNSEKIEKSKVHLKEMERDLIRRALNTGEYFEF